MELYDHAAQQTSELLTNRYSTSFASASGLFPKAVRRHIYNIYGLVRLADEIVDTYRGTDAPDILDGLEAEVYDSLKRGYSANITVHAFQITARAYGITEALVQPFFKSMRRDLSSKKTFSRSEYKDYIFGSAEVVGLMCLKVFTDGDAAQYMHLKDGAAKLGAAYQKINFLRDMAADYRDLGRYYFPDASFESFDEAAKQAVIRDIYKDLETAKKALDQLPPAYRRAVAASYAYYGTLLKKLERTPAEVIKRQRIRIPNIQKLIILAKVISKERLPWQ